MKKRPHRDRASDHWRKPLDQPRCGLRKPSRVEKLFDFSDERRDFSQAALNRLHALFAVVQLFLDCAQLAMQRVVFALAHCSTIDKIVGTQTSKPPAVVATKSAISGV